MVAAEEIGGTWRAAGDIGKEPGGRSFWIGIEISTRLAVLENCWSRKAESGRFFGFVAGF